MNKDEHIIIGFFIGILGGVLGSNFTENFNFIFFLFFVGLTIFASIIPDLFESPTRRNHRKFFHSFIALGVLIILLLWVNIGNQSMLTYLSTSFFLGYLSHLLFDITSKVGLPKY